MITITTIPSTQIPANLIYSTTVKGRSILISAEIKDRIQDLIVTCNASIISKDADYILDLMGDPRILLFEYVSGDEDINHIDFYELI